MPVAIAKHAFKTVKIAREIYRCGENETYTHTFNDTFEDHKEMIPVLKNDIHPCLVVKVEPAM